MQEKVLKELGLSESEINVYLQLLQSGTSKIEPLSERTSLPRTTVYGIVKSIYKKGLASYVVKSGVKYFEATSPRIVLLKEQGRLKRLRDEIPALEALQETVGEKPVIEVYEGKEGLRSIYEDLIRARQQICCYGNIESFSDDLDFFMPHYTKKRAKHSVLLRLITEDSSFAKKMFCSDSNQKIETKFLGAMKDVETLTFIYGENIAIISFAKRQLVGVVIRHKMFSTTKKVIFDILWKTAKEEAQR